MKALILAAGQGDRLEHLTDDIPKALVKVAGVELVSHQLRFLNHPAVTSIGLVTGYHGALLSRFVKQKNPLVRVFENHRFDKGSILTLQCALDFLDDDFLLMNVDHIYPQHLLEHITKQTKEITAVCDFDRKLVDDDMKIKLGSGKKLSKIHKGLKDYDGGYIGMTTCSASKIPAYKNALEQVLSKQGDRASVEMILGELAQNKETIHIADASGHRWLEVDTPEDLKQAEATLKTDPSFLK